MKLISAWRTKLLLVCSGVFLVGASFLIGDLNGITVTGNETYTNPNELSISNSTVEPSGNLTLKAGNTVRFLPGFHAKQGSRLSATIDPNLQGLDVPDNAQNTRFYSDIFSIERPGLSIAGFNNGENNNKLKV